jgi:gliding motility-associated-like protein
MRLFTKQLKMPLLAFVFLLMGVLHAQAQLVHPGILFNTAGLGRLKTYANTERQPWAATYAKLLAYKDINYVQEPVYAIVNRDEGGATSTESRAMSAQSQRAYRCAILWVITGDTTYAHISKTILNSWSGTLDSITGDAKKLCAAWYGFGFVNAAEILRYTNSNWSTADIQRAESMFRYKFYEVIKGFQLGWAGNWDTAISKTMMGIGIFINDEGIYTKGRNFLMSRPGNGDYQNANGTLYNYISGTTGQCFESGRDQEHSQMGIGGLAEACEVVHNQGGSMYEAYSNRLLVGTEYTAKYNLGYSVPFTYSGHYGSVISPDERGAFLPFYELVYNHYVNRLGMSGDPVKYTTMVVEKIRQDNGGESGDAILLGYGSLLFNQYAGFKYVPAAGDYRTTGSSSSMGTPAQFEVFTNGNWITATTALGLETNLLVRNGQSAFVGNTRNLKNLIVGEGNGAVLRTKINGGGAVSALTIVEPGNLSTIPALSFVNGGQPTGATTAVATITKVKVTGADINNRGSGYTSASVTFSGGGGSGAAATPVLSGGKIIDIVIDSSGSNYTSIPTMSVTGNGTGAAVSAKVGITTVSISSGGTGYTIAPTVIAGTFLKVSDGIALSVSTDVFFQRGSSVYTAPASTGILNIRGNLIAEDTVNCISVAHDNTSSSLTVNFTRGSDSIGFMGGNVTFNALGVEAGNTHKLKLGAVMNVAGTITLNSTGIIDATNGAIGFVNVSPSTSTLRTVTANTFKDATLNKMIVNSTAGVTLNPVLTIGTLDMQKGLLNIPETSALIVSSVSGGSSTSYINTKSSASSGAIAQVKVTGLTTAQGDIPLGNGGNYLPVRITPPKDAVFQFTMSVLTGLTGNGLPDGSVVADKSQFVDAIYHVIRTSGEGNYTFRVGFPASLRGSAFTPSSPFGISKYNGNSWLPVIGSGNYVLNTATATFDTNGLRHRVQIGGAQPLNFATATNVSSYTESKAINLTIPEDLVKIKATNIMSPNGDGVNDKWVIDNIDLYPNNEVKVFDKSGRFIYGKKGYDNSWEGTSNGVPLAEGSYYYIVDFGTSRPRFTGFITIARPE